MAWEITYEPEVRGDFKEIGHANVRRVRVAIENKLQNGDPNVFGKPLRGILAGCRSLRVGDMRIIYRVIDDEIRVLILTVGFRRNDDVYETAASRIERE